VYSVGWLNPELVGWVDELVDWLCEIVRSKVNRFVPSKFVINCTSWLISQYRRLVLTLICWIPDWLVLWLSRFINLRVGSLNVWIRWLSLRVRWLIVWNCEVKGQLIHFMKISNWLYEMVHLVRSFVGWLWLSFVELTVDCLIGWARLLIYSLVDWMRGLVNWKREDVCWLCETVSWLCCSCIGFPVDWLAGWMGLLICELVDWICE